MNKLGNILSPTYCLTDREIDYFHEIVANYTVSEPQSTILLQKTDAIIKITHHEHLQILYHEISGSLVGHYIAVHFLNGTLHVYDSLNRFQLHRDIYTYVHRLIGVVEVIEYHKVTQQNNGFDCGLFAIAFISSIVLGKYSIFLKKSYDT